MPEMVAPRARVFRPLVKGIEALGTRLVQPQFAIFKLIRMREDLAWCNGGRRRCYAVEDQHKYCVRIQNGYKMCTQRSR